MDAVILLITYVCGYLFPALVTISAAYTIYALIGFIKEVYADIRSGDVARDRR